MKSVEIKGSVRETIGKKETKALRNAGQVPCVLYGVEAPVHFAAEVSEFRKIVYTPNVYLITLVIDGKECNAIMQDIQFHPVSDEILHVDFLRIFEETPVKINVPVKLEGFAKFIKYDSCIAKPIFDDMRNKVNYLVKNKKIIKEELIKNINIVKNNSINSFSYL